VASGNCSRYDGYHFTEYSPEVYNPFSLLKVSGTAQEALEQIGQKGYAFPYQTDGRKVVKVGVKFNAETRVPEDWVIAG